jgi:hypothetical protein
MTVPLTSGKPYVLKFREVPRHPARPFGIVSAARRFSYASGRHIQLPRREMDRGNTGDHNERSDPVC